MAVTAVTIQDLTLNTFDTDIAYTEATSATDGFTVDVSDYGDQSLLFLVKNTHATTAYDITIKEGDGLQGTYGDLTQEIAATKVGAIAIESGRYKFISDRTYKGKIRLIPENTAVQMAVVALPF